MKVMLSHPFRNEREMDGAQGVVRSNLRESYDLMARKRRLPTAGAPVH
jgi:hypothetical protein